jgi:hypothetical protein
VVISGIRTSDIGFLIRERKLKKTPAAADKVRERSPKFRFCSRGKRYYSRYTVLGLSEVCYGMSRGPGLRVEIIAETGDEESRYSGLSADKHAVRAPRCKFKTWGR